MFLQIGPNAFADSGATNTHSCSNADDHPGRPRGLPDGPHATLKSDTIEDGRLASRVRIRPAAQSCRRRPEGVARTKSVNFAATPLAWRR
jgi:hypothetical protein